MKLLALAALLGAAVASPASLVSYWAAEGDTSDSVGPNPGSAQGTLGYAPTGYGQGWAMSGDDYVDVANPASGGLNTSTGFTVFSIFRADAPSTGADTGSLVNLRTVFNTSGFTLERKFAQPGTMSFFVNTSGAGFEELAVTGWNLGQTYAIAASFDAASHTMKMYRDGALVGTLNGVANGNMVVTGAEAFQIGRNIPNDSRWVGAIDEVRYYNSALTDAQVAAIVPEPATIAALGLGAAALLRRRRRA